MANEVKLEVLVHLQGIGDSLFGADVFAGTRGQSRRLEGFQVTIVPPVNGLTMLYMAHLQDLGDTPWVGEGQFAGTRGQSRRLEGFAIRLSGPSADQYNILYMAHLEGFGDTQYYWDGAFCGTRGQSRRVEGIKVRIDHR